MEPPAATARIKDGRCEVWGPFQSPQAVRNDVAKRLDLPADKVAVNVTLLGGGFGRKSKGDFATEAALLARETGGKPVKVVWTREDDLHHSYYHTVSVERLEAGLDAERQARRLAAPQRRADADGAVHARPEDRVADRARHGAGQRAVRGAQHARREPGGRGAHAHRLVPRGVEHSARLRGPVLRLRDGQRGRTRPEGLPARAARAAAPDRPARHQRHLEPRRGPDRLPDRHRAAAPRGRRRWPRKRTGASRSPRAGARASPRTTASPPTWRRWSRCRWTRPAS